MNSSGENSNINRVYRTCHVGKKIQLNNGAEESAGQAFTSGSSRCNPRRWIVRTNVVEMYFRWLLLLCFRWLPVRVRRALPLPQRPTKSASETFPRRPRVVAERTEGTARPPLQVHLCSRQRDEDFRHRGSPSRNCGEGQTIPHGRVGGVQAFGVHRFPGKSLYSSTC